MDKTKEKNTTEVLTKKPKQAPVVPAPRLFAIKDAIDVHITANGINPATSAPYDTLMEIDYLNDCSFTVESETVYARKKGVNAIAFSSSPTGTFTMNSEVADAHWLGLALGGVVTATEQQPDTGSGITPATETIRVTDILPATTFTIEGVFRCVQEDGTTQYRRITFPNAKPQTSAEVTFSATEVASFSLTFDLLVDPTTKELMIIELADNVVIP